MGVPPSVKQQAELLKCGDATLTVYQGKLRKNVCILSTMHTGLSTFSGAKAKQESVMNYNITKYSVDVLNHMGRAYSVKGGCTSSFFCFRSNLFQLFLIILFFIIYYHKMFYNQISYFLMLFFVFGVFSIKILCNYMQ